MVYIKSATELGCVSDSPAWRYFMRRFADRLRGSASDIPIPYAVEGSWGQEIVDELRDLVPDAPVVRKNRFSAFVNTNLRLLLRSNGISTVIVTGCFTEGSVSATARDAQMYDYYCVVARDCVGSYSKDLHEAALNLLASRCDVKDASEILTVWTSVPLHKGGNS